MQTFYYEGRIEPDVLQLSLDYEPRIARQETSSSPMAEFTVKVFIGRVRVTVKTEHFDEGVAHNLYVPAWDIARALLDTAGFLHAIPYSLTLDRVVLPDGTMKQFTLGDRSLANMHDFTDADLERLSDVMLLDLKHSLALSDLLMTLGKAHYSPIACGRVADSIARLMLPDKPRAEQWEYLRTCLRVDEEFVRSLSNVSTASRHGDRETIDAETNGKTAHRAWQLFARYMRFKLDGDLDAVRYTLLQG